MNEETQEALPENIEVATPGQLLREARESAKYSADDIASKLNLKVSLITAIEENNFDEIASVTFARGYLKSYAKLLHIEESEILAAFEHFTTAEQQQLEMQTFSNRKGKKAVDNWLTIVTVIFVVAIIAGVVVWYMQNHGAGNDAVVQQQPSTSQQQSVTQSQDITSQQTPPQTALTAINQQNDNLSPAGELLVEESNQEANTEQQNSEDLTAPPATEEALLTQSQPQSDIQSDSSSQDQQNSSTSEHTSIEQNDQEQGRSETAQQDTSPTASQEQPQPILEHIDDAQQSNTDEQAQVVKSHLELRFTDSCWINIEDATGERIAIGTKVKGHHTSVYGVAPFTIKLGKPDVVSIWLDGQAREIPYYPKGSIANFELAAE